MGRRVRIIEWDNSNPPEEESNKYFLWDGLAIAEEREGTPPTTVTARYYAQGEIRDGVKYYYGRDHLGSVREVVDESTGNVVARFDYDPYGRREQTVGAGTFDVDWGFTGHYFHEASGLHLAPFRAYSAELGRWLSRDPAGAVDGPNLYRYALSNPVNYFDPLGLITAGGIADCWDVFVDWGANRLAWQGSGPVSFLRNWSHFAGAELAKLPADVLRLGRGAAYAWEGYDPCGKLGPLSRTLYALGDLGRLLEFTPASIPFLPKVKPPKNLPKADAPPVPRSGLELHRPYIRKPVREEVEARALRTPDGRPIDPNTGEIIDGKPDLGHTHGNEFWRAKRDAESEGLTQKEFNERMNNPDFYQLEDPRSNRSHRYEKRD